MWNSSILGPGPHLSLKSKDISAMPHSVPLCVALGVSEYLTAAGAAPTFLHEMRGSLCDQILGHFNYLLSSSPPNVLSVSVCALYLSTFVPASDILCCATIPLARVRPIWESADGPADISADWISAKFSIICISADPWYICREQIYLPISAISADISVQVAKTLWAGMYTSTDNICR